MQYGNANNKNFSLGPHRVITRSQTGGNTGVNNQAPTGTAPQPTLQSEGTGQIPHAQNKMGHSHSLRAVATNTIITPWRTSCCTKAITRLKPGTSSQCYMGQERGT